MENSRKIYWNRLVVILFSLGVCASCSTDKLDLEEEVLSAQMKSSSDSTLIEEHYIIVVSSVPGRENPRAVAALEALTKEVGKMPDARINRTYQNALTGFAAKLSPAQVEKMRKDPRIQSVEQDRYVYPIGDLVVQEYTTWGLDRIDQQGKTLDRAYVYTATGTGVTAYIVDTGIRYTHNEFGGRASLGYDFVLEEDPENTRAGQKAGEDCIGHGTHVAGTVGGKEYGVAKNVDLLSVRVFGCSGGSPRSRIIAAVDWITQDVQKNNRFPAVVNMSLGGPYDPDGLSYEVAIRNSVEAGVNYILAAGNWSDDACNFEPARHPLALTVGASQIGDEMAYFSNYGDCVDLYAPGVSITSAIHTDDVTLGTYSGTSMAAPHVAGIAALYLEKNPDTSPADLHAGIISNSIPDVVLNVPSGTNRLAHSLYEPVTFSPPTPPNLNLKAYGFKNGKETEIHLTWDPTEDPIMEIYRNGQYYSRWYNDGRYKLQVRGNGNDKFKICEENYHNCSAEVTADFENTGDFEPNVSPVPDFTYTVNNLQVEFTDTSTDIDGTIISWTWYFGDNSRSGLQNPIHTYSTPGTYRVELLIQDNYHDLQYIIKYVTVGDVNANEPPVADFSYNKNSLGVEFMDASTDPDGSIMNWNWDFGDGNSSTLQNPQHTFSEAGDYSVSLTVTDDSGDTGMTSKLISVSSENPDPGGLVLSATGTKVKGKWQTSLSWSPSVIVDIYRDGIPIANNISSSSYTDSTELKGSGSLTYKICEAGTAVCSNEVTIQF